MWPQTIKQGMPTKIPQCNLNSELQTYSLKSKTVQYSLTCPIINTYMYMSFCDSDMSIVS